MPQLAKGGKFVYGLSLINDNLTINVPPQAADEYKIVSEGKVYLSSGSKITGGFIVSRKGLLYDSQIGNILKENPKLCNYGLKMGEAIRYKGRFYCWTNISEDGAITLTENILKQFEIKRGMKLMSIRSSDIAFTMGAKGPLLEMTQHYDGVFDEF